MHTSAISQWTDVWWVACLYLLLVFLMSCAWTLSLFHTCSHLECFHTRVPYMYPGWYLNIPMSCSPSDSN